MTGYDFDRIPTPFSHLPIRFLALDIGTRRTGVAYLDDATGIPLPLDTIKHSSEKELLLVVTELLSARSIDRVIVGLPKLPNGTEGSQAKISRAFGEKLREAGWNVSFVDERFTSPRSTPQKHAPPATFYDGDAAAACELLRGTI